MKTATSFELIALPCHHEYILTTEQAILYCSSDGNYTEVHLLDGKKVTICKKLKEVEQTLSSDYFIRVHHSYIINLLHATKFSKRDGWQIMLRNGSAISVSRSNRDKLMERIHTL